MDLGVMLTNYDKIIQEWQMYECIKKSPKDLTPRPAIGSARGTGVSLTPERRLTKVGYESSMVSMIICTYELIIQKSTIHVFVRWIYLGMDLFGNIRFGDAEKKLMSVSENHGLFVTLTRLVFKLELKWPQNLYLNMRYPQIDPFPTTIITWYMHTFKDIHIHKCVYIYMYFISMVFLYKTNKSRCLETWPKLIVHNISFHPPLRPKPRCECLWLAGMAWVSPVPIIPGSGSQVTLRKKPTGIWLFIQRHHESLYILQ